MWAPCIVHGKPTCRAASELLPYPPRMGKISVGISVLVGVFVAAVIGQAVLFRASWLLPADFDPNAFLILGGPTVGLLLLVIGISTFWGSRVMLKRHDALSRRVLLSQTARFAILGICGGMAVGGTAAWLLIAVDGMGNDGDTSIVRFEVRDFVQAALWGIGVFLAAALSIRPPKRP